LRQAAGEQSLMIHFACLPAFVLQIAIKESNVASHPNNIPIAKAALQQLLALLQTNKDKEGSADASSDDSFALTEADVLKTLVKVHQQVRVCMQGLEPARRQLKLSSIWLKLKLRATCSPACPPSCLWLHSKSITTKRK
jgi:hypothetical protein